MSEIQIEVQGHKATVISLQPTYGTNGEEQFVVCVDFGKDHPLKVPVMNKPNCEITSMGVHIPRRRYTRSHFIKAVTKAIQQEVEKAKRITKEAEQQLSETKKFDRFTRELAKELGIGAE